ncbi:alpha/beta hydrolase [Mycolicibacterium moriokaense]|jgi:pimeloyl-ACP methyl ester carboxylesterase|uniref:Alpha/beta hydrolase n=1 Tax=Mycolicibacterium moriokaense TaxID=39691 RepID=A0AAD1HA36_9MYCO|nr:alpha/beta hydrolase [Mycolicibacterium moriokaense]MCV7041253.1 alpha/beta hydrolase [Mycolicibacterium moriokaense]ORB27150.1 alpha/beta hydrolase [Mycolicibacterium moriokaense]BBX00819.1 alpha/beta hydrolase [Mycolicibacterium moriokaense]
MFATDKAVPTVGYLDRRVTTSDGVRLAVRDFGRVDAEHTIVLLHGLCLTQDSWAAQVRDLVQRWGNSIRIITYDHRGHGASSSAPMRTYRIGRLAADLANVLSALNVTGALTLVGHSMGGMTALEYIGRPAVHRPVEPRGLVLVATAAGKLAERGIGRLISTPATEMLCEIVERAPRFVTDRAIKSVVKPLSDALLAIPGLDPGARTGLAALPKNTLTTAAGFLLGLKRYDQYDALESITATAVVVSGGMDFATPVSHSDDLADAIADAVHLHVPSAGHMLPQEAPQHVSSAINLALSVTDSAQGSLATVS